MIWGTLSFLLAIKKSKWTKTKTFTFAVALKEPGVCYVLTKGCFILLNFSYEVFLFYVHVVNHRIYAASEFKEG